jgi:hypothetical protein
VRPNAGAENGADRGVLVVDEEMEEPNTSPESKLKEWGKRRNGVKGIGIWSKTEPQEDTKFSLGLKYFSFMLSDPKINPLLVMQMATWDSYV